MSVVNCSRKRQPSCAPRLQERNKQRPASRPHPIFDQPLHSTILNGTAALARRGLDFDHHTHVSPPKGSNREDMHLHGQSVQQFSQATRCNHRRGTQDDRLAFGSMSMYPRSGCRSSPPQSSALGRSPRSVFHSLVFFVMECAFA